MQRRLLVTAAATGAGLTLLASSGCALLPRPAVVPMPATRIASGCAPPGGGQAPVLLVMLPGAYSRPAEFIEEGFVQTLQERGVWADVAIADAHLGYFNDGSVLKRLRADIIQPARAHGYDQVWLVGISLGGLGALGYASSTGQAPGDGVDGVLALAPYLGSQRLLNEVSAAGGPAAWAASLPPENAATAAQAQAQAHPIEAAEQALWRWLAAPPPGAPPVYLGYGRDDRLGAGHRLLAGHLARERVIAVPGGHDWPPWLALWRQWLALGLLPGGCARQARA